MTHVAYRIGRVGALAVALGIGVAVASMSGAAAADTPEAGTSASSTPAAGPSAAREKREARQPRTRKVVVRQDVSDVRDDEPTGGDEPAPVQPQAAVSMLASAPREDRRTRVGRGIQRALFNKTPVTGYDPAENIQTLGTGREVNAVEGDLMARDADDDPLRYTVVRDPGKGTVAVNPDGTFVYTPGRELATAGGTDQFTVKVGDVGWHLHGLSGVFKPNFGRTTTTTVDISVVANCGGACQANPLKVIAEIEVGDGPDGVTVSPDGARVYVANALDDTVSVIDTSTDTVTATIPVGNYPRGVAVNPAGTRVYVTNLLQGTVSVINTGTKAVIATIPVGTSAERVAVNATGSRVYVIGSQTTGSALSVINTLTNGVTWKATLNGTGYGLAVSPQDGRVFVATQIGWLDVINPATHLVTHVATGAGWMRGIAVNPLGTRVYIANSDSGTVSVRDAYSYALVATIGVGENPNGAAINPAGSRVLVVNEGDNTVSVIRTSTNTVLSTIDVGFLPHSVAISPDGTRAYVTNGGSDTVSVIQLL